LLEPLALQSGDYVWIIADGKRIKALVGLASPNSYSLMLYFDAMVWGYLGAMPILWVEAEHKYHDLVRREEVQLEKAEQRQR